MSIEQRQTYVILDMSVCQQQVESTQTELIQGLPPELQEMIYKEYISSNKKETARGAEAAKRNGLG